MGAITISFPNHRSYHLYPERNLTHKYGLDFPSEIDKKTLFLAGISGTGKSSLATRICEEEHIHYFGQTFILLREKPALYRSPGSNSFHDLTRKKIIDGHFLFPIPSTKRNYSYEHEDSICHADYDFLTLKNNFLFDNEIKENMVFEFRQLKPLLIQIARKKREKAKKSGYDKFRYHTYRRQTRREIKKEEYLLYQVAHNLFEQGADVYVRTSFKGTPLRFLE